MNLFEGTAKYYRHFRSGVPEAMAQLLDEAALRPVDRPRRLLDIEREPVAGRTSGTG